MENLTIAQVNKLRDTWNTIERINPESKSYKNMTETMNKVSNANLKIIADAKINFLSTKARFILADRARIIENLRAR